MSRSLFGASPRLAFFIGLISTVTAAGSFGVVTRSPDKPGAAVSEAAALAAVAAGEERSAGERKSPSRGRHQSGRRAHYEPRAARSLLVQRFGGYLRNALAVPGDELPAGTKVDRYRGETAAVVRRGKRRGLLVSQLPLRVGKRGDKRPIDLRLERAGGALRPRRPLVPVSFPYRLGGGVATKGMRIRPAGAATGRARVLAGSDQLAFYPRSDRDTDFVLVPRATGFEALWQLRSARAPERFALDHQLPRGAALRQVGQEVRIMRGSRLIGHVRAPQAMDAAGQQLRVSARLAGNRLVLALRHHSADVEYPVLLDPTYQLYESWTGWRSGNPEGLTAWQYRSNHPLIYGGYTCDGFSLSNCDNNTLTGLFIMAKPTWYQDGNYGEYVYTAPGYGSCDSYVRWIKGAYMRNTWEGGGNNQAYAYVGIRSPRVNQWTAYTAVGQFANPPYNPSDLTAGVDPSTGNGTNVAGGDWSCGKEAVFQLRFSGAGNRSTISNLSVGGAELIMEDNQVPAISSSKTRLSWNPGSWYAGNGTISVNTEFGDLGFGINRIGVKTFLPNGTQDQSLSVPMGCTGTYEARCPHWAEREIPVETLTLPEGVNTVHAHAVDAAEKGSDGNANKWAHKVDRAAPSIAFTGQFTGQTAAVVEAGTYTIGAQAVDCTGTSNAALRSGVRSMVIKLNGNPIPGASYAAPNTEICDASVAPSVTLPAGEHVITLDAVDWVGHSSMQTLAVTVVPEIGPPENTSVPTVTGVAREGQTLTATEGTWVAAGAVTTSYQWQRCAVGGSCEDIPGATASTYPVFFADVERRLRVRVRKTNTAGHTDAFSSTTGVVVSTAATAPGKDLDAIPVAPPLASTAADSCVPDASYPGGEDCAEAGDDPLEAEAAAAGSPILHRGYGMSDDYRTTDSMQLFGGPYLRPPDYTRPELCVGGTFSPTRPEERQRSDEARFDQALSSPNAPATEPPGLRKVRLIVPYDIMAGKFCPGPAPTPGEVALRNAYYRVAEWITAATANGKQILVSFERSVVNPNEPAPSVTAYGDMVQRFRDEFPQVKDFTAWNEPNHPSQPTVSNGRRAAEYWVHLQWRCRRIGPTTCYVAAGDFIDPLFSVDAGKEDPFFKAYKDGLSGRKPKIWAFHAYRTIRRPGAANPPLVRFIESLNRDLKYPCGDGRRCEPRIWLTEQGGLVFREEADQTVDGVRCDGQYGASSTETTYAGAVTRANSDLSTFFAKLDGTTYDEGRLTRFYYYDWAGTPTFDAGLLYARFHSYLNGQPEADCAQYGSSGSKPGDSRPAYTTFRDQVRAAQFE